MKLKFLFFYLISCTVLLADTNGACKENMFEDYILDQLASGHSIEAVMKQLNMSKISHESSNHQKLAQDTIDNLIHIIMNNNHESKKFYARKNFIATCEILAGIATMLIIVYFLYNNLKNNKLKKFNSTQRQPSDLEHNQNKFMYPLPRSMRSIKKIPTQNIGPMRFRKVSTIDHKLNRAIDKQFEHAKHIGLAPSDFYVQ